jgi:type IV fimbrial biogenesis protein FimT
MTARFSPTPTYGFTLVELLVVIAIASILATIAIPSLITTIQMNRADTASNQFAAALSMARSEAVKQGTVMTVISGTGLHDWGTAGWTVCCAPAPAPAGTTLQAGAALTVPMTNYGSAPSISFNPMGRLPPNAAPVKFVFCPTGTNLTNARLVTVSLSGRVRVVSPDAAGVLYDDNQIAITSCIQ